MEIIRNENNTEIYFSKLRVGEVFVTSHDNPNTYLKIEETYSGISGEEIEAFCEGQMTTNDFDEHRCNAINLNDMQYHYFSSYDEVIFKPSKLILE